MVRVPSNKRHLEASITGEAWEAIRQPVQLGIGNPQFQVETQKYFRGVGTLHPEAILVIGVLPKLSDPEVLLAVQALLTGFGLCSHGLRSGGRTGLGSQVS